MSWEALYWAQNQITGSVISKAVLIALANCENEETRLCYPSVTHLAKVTEANKKSVYAALHKLEDMDLISIQERKGTSSRYDLKVDFSTIPKNGYTQKRIEGVPKNGSGDYPKTGNKPNITTSDNKPDRNKRLCFDHIPPEYKDSMNEFVDHRKNMKKPLTQPALDRFMNAAIRTAQELELDPNFVIHETIDAGWQSIKPEWLRNRLGLNNVPGSSDSSGKTRDRSLEEDLNDRSWAH